MKRRYFGTDGVRGGYGGPVINETFAARLGFAAARWRGGRGRAVIGYDTRASGPSLAAAVAAGLTAAGMQPEWLGIVPTPAVAFEARRRGAALGVVVTASHNPAADNGIKFFTGTGMKLTDADEAAIESLLPTELVVDPWAPPADAPSALGGYIEQASGLMPADALRGWRMVVDTANGATCVTTPRVLHRLGAELLQIGANPDGRNINAGVGSEHPEALAAQVRASGARLGLAHDGDGDRCVLCDEYGEVLDGDEILTILALHALRFGTLADGRLVVTVQSNLGVDAAITAAGGEVSRTAVGDRYVIERMQALGATLGGESSGHIICADVSPTGDGLVAALRVLRVMLETGKPLSELRRGLRKFPQQTAALVVAAKRELQSCATIAAEVARLEGELGRRGRVLVRYSGTEPKLRLLVEGPDDATVAAAMARLERATRIDLDVRD
ncbi:MAG TPA: phosphoglucosamine mutase [Candidatus Synoicihabitans sp.]|nr:phosphoglucosamine mutase [Candidatus Synoicihabitans sp.]